MENEMRDALERMSRKRKIYGGSLRDMLNQTARAQEELAAHLQTILAENEGKVVTIIHDEIIIEE